MYNVSTNVAQYLNCFEKNFMSTLFVFTYSVYSALTSVIFTIENIQKIRSFQCFLSFSHYGGKYYFLPDIRLLVTHFYFHSQLLVTKNCPVSTILRMQTILMRVYLFLVTLCLSFFFFFCKLLPGFYKYSLRTPAASNLLSRLSLLPRVYDFIEFL